MEKFVEGVLEGLGVWFILDYVFALNPAFNIRKHMTWQICLIVILSASCLAVSHWYTSRKK